MISSRVGPFVAFWYCNSYVPRGTFPYLSVNTLRSSHLSSTHVLLKKSHTQIILGHAGPGTTAIYTHMTEKVFGSARKAIEGMAQAV